MVEFKVGETVEHFITTGNKKPGKDGELIVSRWKVKVVEVRKKVITVHLPNGVNKKCQIKNLAKI